MLPYYHSSAYKYLGVNWGYYHSIGETGDGIEATESADCVGRKTTITAQLAEGGGDFMESAEMGLRLLLLLLLLLMGRTSCGTRFRGGRHRHEFGDHGSRIATCGLRLLKDFLVQLSILNPNCTSIKLAPILLSTTNLKHHNPNYIQWGAGEVGRKVPPLLQL